MVSSPGSCVCELTNQSRLDVWVGLKKSKPVLLTDLLLTIKALKKKKL